MLLFLPRRRFFGLLLCLLLIRKDSSSSFVRAQEGGDEESDNDWDDEEDGDEMPSGTTMCPGKNPIVTDVLVIGAGLAGMFAAATLGKNGLNYRLLEMHDAVGGRMNAFKSKFVYPPGTVNEGKNIVLERGANFMYGLGNEYRLNPIFGLFEKYGADFAIVKDETDWATYEPDGTKIPQDIVHQQRDTYIRAVQNCLNAEGERWFEDWTRNGTTSDDVSNLETLRTCPGAPDSAWVPDNSLKNAIQSFFHEQENGIRLEESGKGVYPEDSYYDFDRRVFIQKNQDGGSNKATRKFAKREIKKKWLHLNSRVTRIRYSSDKKAKVVAKRTLTSADGSTYTCRQQYRAEYVINTMPQNVLFKKKDTKLFNPKLDIDNHPITMNVMEKVWFQYSSAWWDESVSLLVTNELRDGQSTTWFNFNHPDLLPGSNILLTFVNKYQLEAMGGTIKPDVLIKAFENHPNFPANETPEVYFTDWRNDPRFEGSWEIWEVGRNKNYKDYAQATRPQERLHKAGAAHCDRWWGFTWSAMMSGIWQAEWVVNRFNGMSIDDAKPYSPCTDPSRVTSSEWRGLIKESGYNFWNMPVDTSGYE